MVCWKEEKKEAPVFLAGGSPSHSFIPYIPYRPSGRDSGSYSLGGDDPGYRKLGAQSGTHRDYRSQLCKAGSDQGLNGRVEEGEKSVGFVRQEEFFTGGHGKRISLRKLLGAEGGRR